MKYVEKYNRYIDDDCVIYRFRKGNGKFVQVKPSINNCGYEFICYKEHSIVYVHRLVYEAFKGEIPEGLEIDHIDRNKHNNSPDNLRLVTRSENLRNTDRKGTKLTEEHKQKIREKLKKVWYEGRHNRDSKGMFCKNDKEQDK
jgi:hypothetical protein